MNNLDVNSGATNSNGTAIEGELAQLKRQINAVLAHVEGHQVPRSEYDHLFNECQLLESIVDNQRVILLRLLQSELLDASVQQNLFQYCLDLNEWDAVQAAQETLDRLASERLGQEDSEAETYDFVLDGNETNIGNFEEVSEPDFLAMTEDSTGGAGGLITSETRKDAEEPQSEPVIRDSNPARIR